MPAAQNWVEDCGSLLTFTNVIQIPPYNGNFT